MVWCRFCRLPACLAFEVDPYSLPFAMFVSLKMQVNFRLLHLMCEAEGGSVLHSRHLDGFKCSAMTYGLEPKVRICSRVHLVATVLFWSTKRETSVAEAFRA